MRARLLALFRPRFSLRTMLVLMAFVAVGLAIWRWPWQEEHVLSGMVLHAPTPSRAMVAGPATRSRVQCRRGWWGEKLKHGPEEAFDYEGRLIARQLWHDGEQHGQEIWYDRGGHVIVEQTWQHDTLTGPFRYGDGFSWLESGEHWRGQRHGKCIDQEQWFSREIIERVATFDRDELHGECLWRSLRTGEVLQNGRYEKGLLVEWNGEELNSFAKHWATFRVVAGGTLAIQIDPTLDRNRVPLEIPNDSDNFPASLLSALLPWGLTIEPRFGRIWVVRADEVGLTSDPTGVSSVVPFPGTRFAEAWEKSDAYSTLNRDRYLKLDRQAFLDNLVDRWPLGGEVKLDLTTHGLDVDAAHRLQNGGDLIRPSGAPLPDVGELLLRDFVATRLYQAGLQCKLSGDRDRLVISPHWTTRRLANGN